MDARRDGEQWLEEHWETPSSLDLYRIVREWIRDEHGLLATRIGWLSAINTLLYGGLTQVSGPGSIPMLQWIAAIAGLVFTSLSAPGIAAASVTLETWVLREKALMKAAPELRILAPTYKDPFWPGRCRSAHPLSLVLPKCVCGFFALFWLAVMLYLLVSPPAGG